MNTKQAGFTLIELVIVIVLLGILAAVAVPKFVDLSSDASTNANAFSSGASDERTATTTACEAMKTATSSTVNCNP